MCYICYSIVEKFGRIERPLLLLLPPPFPSTWSFMPRLGNLGFFLGKLEILIVALSKSTYQSQRSRVQLPVGA